MAKQAHSRGKRAFFLFVNAVVLLLQACNSHPGAFEVSPVTLVQSQVSQSDPVWGVPTQKAFYLRACLTDRVTLGSFLRGEELRIEGGAAPTQVTTDPRGCVNWTETINFLYLAPESFIELPRKISTATHSAEFTLAVNPWSETSDNLVDTRVRTEIPHLVGREIAAGALAGEGSFSPETSLKPDLQTNTWVERIDLEVLELGNTATTNRRAFDLNFFVQAMRRKWQGPLKKVELPTGKYEVTLKVFERRPGKDELVLLAESKPIVADVKQGRISQRVELEFGQSPAETSEIDLVYALKPIDPNIGLLASDGKIRISLQGKSSAVPVNVEAIRPVLPAVESRGSREVGFRLKDWQVDFGAEQAYDPNQWQAGIRVNANVCVINALSSLQIAGHDFQAQISDVAEGVDNGWIAAPSNSHGCLTWSQEIRYNDADDQKYTKKYLVIRSRVAPYVEISRHVEIALNPWQRGAQVYWDSTRKGSPPVNPRAGEAAKILLPSYSYHFGKRDFEINRYLELSSHRTYDFVFAPKLFRAHTFDRGAVRDELKPRTRIRVRTILYENDDPSKVENFLSAFETLAETDDSGEIPTQGLFIHDFTEQPRLERRLRVAVELSPIGGGTLPSSCFVKAPFLPVTTASDQGSGRFSQCGPSIDFAKLIADAKAVGYAYGPGKVSYRRQSSWVQPPLQMFTSFWEGFASFQKIALTAEADKPTPGAWETWETWTAKGSPASRAVSRAAIDAALGGDVEKMRAALTPFCELHADTWKAKCRQHPGTYFQASAATIVEEIASVMPKEHELVRSLLQISSLFFKDIGLVERDIVGDRTSEEFSRGVSAKIGFEQFGNGATAHTGYTWENQWYSAREVAIGRDVKTRVSTLDQIALKIEEIKVPLQLKVRRCLMVRPFVVPLTVTPTEGYFFCEGKSDLAARESWIDLRDTTNQDGSAHVDIKDPRDRGWHKLIRGQNAYHAFRATVADKTRNFLLEKAQLLTAAPHTMLGTDFNSAKSILQRDGGIFPGVLSFQQSSTGYWTELQIRRYTNLCTPAQGDEKQRRRDSRYCRCFYESASRRYLHSDYIAKLADSEKALDESGVTDMCIDYARRGE